MNLKEANKLFQQKKYTEARKAYKYLYKQSNNKLAKQNLDILDFKESKSSYIESKALAKKENYDENKDNTLCSSEEHWFEHLSNDVNFNWFLAMAKKTRSVDSRDMVSLLATNKNFNYKTLEGILETYRIISFRDKVLDVLNNKINNKYWLELARLVFSQNENLYDNINAKTLYDIVIKKHGIQELSGVDVSYLSIIQTHLGFYKSARNTIIKSNEKDKNRRLNHWLLLINALHPKSGNKIENWLSELNKVFVEKKLEGVKLSNDDKKIFYRLGASQKTRKKGVKLSVLMPVYSPNESTLLAINSILNQTWENIELIVVDDATPYSLYNDKIFSEIKEIVDRDTRVEIVFNKENRGAYHVRNTAYDLATGKYVTVADKDDWHHPNKYEIQIDDLEQNPKKIANIVSWARVNEDMEFVARWGPDRIAHPSFASLMFRREKVKKDIGYWDTVRKSADGEFKMRLQKFYGIKLNPILDVPLAFSLMANDNLTSEDLGMGYESNDRAFYMRSFEAWHNKIDSIDSLYVSFPQEKRKFPAPKSFLPIKEKNTQVYDVVFMSEYGFEAGNNTVLINEIKACLKIGLKVGVIMLQNFYIESAAKRHFTDEIYKLIFSNEIHRLTLEDDATIKLLLVRWPTILQYVGSKKSQLSAQRILIVANHAPYDEINNRRSYDVNKVSHNIRFLFDQYPIWAPESEQILPMIKPLLPPELMHQQTWKGIIADECVKNKSINFNNKPRIGRHARDSVMKWPDNKADFRSVYPVDGSFNVTILGGGSVPLKEGFVTAKEIKNWEVYKFNEIKVCEYLNKLDFFVYFHHAKMTEAFGMSIIEAMQHGVVCVLPHNFSKVFNNGAIYCNPNEVRETIKSLWENPDAYKKQQEKGWSFFEKNCSLTSFEKRITEFLEDK